MAAHDSQERAVLGSQYLREKAFERLTFLFDHSDLTATDIDHQSDRQRQVDVAPKRTNLEALSLVENREVFPAQVPDGRSVTGRDGGRNHHFADIHTDV